jgi:hypothetical protein
MGDALLVGEEVGTAFLGRLPYSKDANRVDFIELTLLSYGRGGFFRGAEGRDFFRGAQWMVAMILILSFASSDNCSSSFLRAAPTLEETGQPCGAERKYAGGIT